MLTGVVIAGLIYLVLVISECLPRDDSLAMLACEAVKQRDFWLYPVLLTISLAGCIALYLRGAVGSWLVAMTAGLHAAVALTLINALLG